MKKLLFLSTLIFNTAIFAGGTSCNFSDGPYLGQDVFIDYSFNKIEIYFQENQNGDGNLELSYLVDTRTDIENSRLYRAVNQGSAVEIVIAKDTNKGSVSFGTLDGQGTLSRSEKYNIECNFIIDL